MLRLLLVSLASLTVVSVCAPPSAAQLSKSCRDDIEGALGVFCGSSPSGEALKILVQIAIDGNTDAIGGGVCLDSPLGSASGEGCIDIVTGDQSFAEDEAAFRSGGQLEPPRYIAVQAYVHGRYPIPVGDEARGLSVYPLAGPRLYYWDPESCEDNPEVFCEESEVSFGFDLGVGAGYGPVRADVFTGLGGVPSVSARLKLRLFSL